MTDNANGFVLQKFNVTHLTITDDPQERFLIITNESHNRIINPFRPNLQNDEHDYYLYYVMEEEAKFRAEYRRPEKTPTD